MAENIIKLNEKKKNKVSGNSMHHKDKIGWFHRTTIGNIETTIACESFSLDFFGARKKCYCHGQVKTDIQAFT